MRILEDDSIALRPRDGGIPDAEVLVEGAPTAHVVRGVVLEAAVETGSGYLLFTTDDVPFEEALNVTLLGADGTPEEHLTIGRAYSSGAFSGLEITGPGVLRFRFFEELEWTLRLLPTKRWQVPWISDPAGVMRPFTLRSRLVITSRQV